MASHSSSEKPRTSSSIDSSGALDSPSGMSGRVTSSSHGIEAVINQKGRGDPMIEQAKRFAVAQAQEDGCTGSYRSFDSQFKNYLLPVIPTLDDLKRHGNEL
ncbi:hypothetical protein AMTRI_Chr05g58290 [Amborella trichopoda]